MNLLFFNSSLLDRNFWAVHLHLSLKGSHDVIVHFFGYQVRDGLLGNSLFFVFGLAYSFLEHFFVSQDMLDGFNDIFWFGIRCIDVSCWMHSICLKHFHQLIRFFIRASRIFRRRTNLTIKDGNLQLLFLSLLKIIKSAQVLIINNWFVLFSIKIANIVQLLILSIFY